MTKGQRTANRILDIAEELFARHGFDATSLRQIAELAQIQQPGLYKHFASKEKHSRLNFHRRSRRRLKALKNCKALMRRLEAQRD